MAWPGHNPFLLLVPAGDHHDRGYLRDFQLYDDGLTLTEYQLYAVEQWLVDRKRPSSLIMVSTNDPSHKIKVDVLTPKAATYDESMVIWNRSMVQARAYGARPKQTPRGYVLAVSLLDFRSDLTIVLLPSGDYTLAKDALFTNINLRRLGCGGRSGLNLSDPSAAQQERLLSTYRLPNVASDMHAFTMTVLGLVKLVQSALALFNLGPMANDRTGVLIPDGLLCDSTVEGLVAWQIEVAEPLLQTELGESILSGATLAALLSTVMSVRCRFLAMGIHHISADPFQNRGSFLATYEAFMKTTKTTLDARYLSAAGIYHFKQQYTRTTKESLKRAIRHRLDDIRGEGSATNTNKASLFEDETTDIATFVNAIRHIPSGELQSVVTLWKGQYSKGTTGGGSSGAAATARKSVPQETEGGGHGGAATSESSESDSESGIGTKILRGVSRGTKKIGGGVTGLLDISGSRHHHTNKDEGSRAKGKSRTLSSLDGGSPRRGSAPLDAPASVTMPSANPTRLSVLDGSVRDGHEAGTGQGDGESYRGSAGARPANMRRSITDIQPQTSIESLRQRQRSRIPPSIRERRYSFDCMRNTPRLAHVMSARSMQVDVELRMTYHELKKREAQLEKLVRALTSVDETFELALQRIAPHFRQRGDTVRELEARGKRLAHEIEAFTSTSGVNLLPTHTGRDASTGSEASTGPGRDAILSLAVSTERLSYAQTILEEKVKDIEHFHSNLSAKIEGSEVLLVPPQERPAPPEQLGSIVKGLQEFVESGSSARLGTLRAMFSFDIWDRWLAHLKKLVGKYL